MSDINRLRFMDTLLTDIFKGIFHRANRFLTMFPVFSTI